MNRHYRTALVIALVLSRPDLAAADGWLDYIRWFDGLSGPQYHGIVINPELVCGFKESGTDSWQIEPANFLLYCDDNPAKKRDLKWGIGLRLQVLRGHSLGDEWQFPASREASSLGLVGFGGRAFYRPKNWAQVDVAGMVHDFRPGPTVTSLDISLAARIVPLPSSSPSSRRGLWLGVNGTQFFGAFRRENFGAAAGPVDNRERAAGLFLSVRF